MKGGRFMLAVCCALAAMVAGCGEESSPRTTSASTAASSTPTTTTTTQPTPDPMSRESLAAKMVPTRWKRPPQRITAHPKAQIGRVIVHDVKKGTGPAVRPTDYVLIDYIEADWRKGDIFYEGWGEEPNPTAGVILTRTGRWRGFVIGMTGMRVGGRRRILVPPRLSGQEADHAEYNTVLYWDVVLRGIYARGCEADGEPCKSGP